jgi:hypothetical protein
VSAGRAGTARRETGRAKVHGEAAYAALASKLTADARVVVPSERRGKFGTNSFKVDGKVFAMWVRGALVVKLPQSEIDAAVAAERGERLSMGKRVMKDWLVVHEDERRWPAIARRACAYVGKQSVPGSGSPSRPSKTDAKTQRAASLKKP